MASTCMIVAGPNGSGKTTFAMSYLPRLGCRTFINADLIAAGLSPLSPDKENMTASRLFLGEIAGHMARGETFAFESTLSGLMYLKLIKEQLSLGWNIELFYLWLPDVDFARRRVAERVASGGHFIPDEVIKRRYYRSIRNLLSIYAPLCSRTLCIDNSTPGRTVIFRESKEGRKIEDELRYQIMVQQAG